MTDAPIRLFVGAAANSDDLESLAVLEHSLRKHASLPVEFGVMRLSKDPESPFYSDGGAGWQTEAWSTPFSGFRWIVPELCHWEGRAIYLDSDFIIRADIAELWGQDMRGKALLGKGGVESWRFCCALWDCAAAAQFKSQLSQARGRGGHSQCQSFFRASIATGAFDGAWNVIDGEDFADIRDPRIKALHYSSEQHQPHLKHALPRLVDAGEDHWFVATGGRPKPHWRADVQDLFDDELAEAIAAGYKPELYAPAEPFGAYPIQSHANYRPNRWAPRGA